MPDFHNNHNLFQWYLVVIIFFSCSMPTGLEPVSGVEGSIIVKEALFNSGKIKGVVIVALDQLAPDNPTDHLLSYSDPVLPDTTNSMTGDSLFRFFIQLKPPNAVLVPVGLTVDPSYFIINLESYLADSSALPIVFPVIEDPQDVAEKTRSIRIVKNEITLLPDPWVISF